MAISFPLSPTAGQVYTAPSSVIYRFDGVKWVGQAVAAAAPAMPTGFIGHYAANAIPTGFLKCNGAAISRSTYAALFTVVGTTYGVGDGSTTFNVPDLRGEFVRGLDDGRGVDAGRVIGTAQADEFKSHTHTTPTGGGAGYGQPAGGAPAGASTTGAAGGSETRPRNVAMLACIKY